MLIQAVALRLRLHVATKQSHAVATVVYAEFPPKTPFPGNSGGNGTASRSCLVVMEHPRIYVLCRTFEETIMGALAEITCTGPPLCGSTSSPPVSLPDAQCELVVAQPGTSGNLIKPGRGGKRPNTGGSRLGSTRTPRPVAQHVRAIQRSPLGPRWHVLRIIASARERITQDLLLGEAHGVLLGKTEDVQHGAIGRHLPSRQPFPVYCPMQAVERTRHGIMTRGADGKHEIDHVPCYIGYAFVEFDRNLDPWGPIAQVDGVLGVISTRSGVPIPLAPDWHAREVGWEQQRMRLPDVVMDCFAAGQELVVVDGPFARFRAICQECNGLTTKVAVNILGHSTKTTMRRDWLVAAGDAAAGLD